MNARAPARFTGGVFVGLGLMILLTDRPWLAPLVFGCGVVLWALGVQRWRELPPAEPCDGQHRRASAYLDTLSDLDPSPVMVRTIEATRRRPRHRAAGAAR